MRCAVPVLFAALLAATCAPTDRLDTGAYERLFECPAAVEFPADVVGYVEVLDGDEIAGFYETLRALATQRIDESCLSDCSRSAARQCVAASCVTGLGDRVEYTRTREVRGASEAGGARIVELAEAIVVEPTSAGESWSVLRLKRRGLSISEADALQERWEIDVSWEGILLEGWPADFAIHGSTREWAAGDDWGGLAEWSHERCSVAVGAGDQLLRSTGAEARVAIDGHRVEILPGGEARFAGWDDGSHPIRRCSAHYCVALEGVPRLRSP
jgi:hypothetical protein